MVLKTLEKGVVPMGGVEDYEKRHSYTKKILLLENDLNQKEQEIQII